MTPLLILFVVGIIGYCIYKHLFNRPTNFPPGPPRLPVWGSYWWLLLSNYKYAHRAVHNLTKYYKTKVLGFYLGPYPTIVANDYSSVKEIMTRPEFQGRPDSLFTLARADGKRRGIFFVDGPFWAEQKRFTLWHLRDFGFGRRLAASEQLLEEEVQDFLCLLRGEWSAKEIRKGDAFLFPASFYLLFMNVISVPLTGTRYDRSDFSSVWELAQSAALFVHEVDPLGRAVSMTPWLHSILPCVTGVLNAVKSNSKLLEHIKKLVTEHETTHSSDHMRDFVDVYIKEKKNRAGIEETSFTDDQLLLVGVDMLLGGISTVVAQMSFLLKCLLHYPEVQKKIQQELDVAVGRDRLPTLDDRCNLQYTEAAILEGMRRQFVLPLGLPRMATEDTKLKGYNIPKNTLVFTNLWSVNMDPEVWGDPENFRPERFLDENGKVKNSEVFLPFGSGKRLCPGETYSRQSMFIILASMLQNFTFSYKCPKKLPSLDKMHSGITVAPTDLWVTVHPRH